MKLLIRALALTLFAAGTSASFAITDHAGTSIAHHQTVGGFAPIPNCPTGSKLCSKPE